MSAHDVVSRPRIEGDREREILLAALEVVAETGYDRLTMDLVAQRARASKATLYRRWSSKTQLIIDALLHQKPAPVIPDTGSLRGDLLASYCGAGGITDHQQTAVFASVLTAIMRDEEFATAFRRDVMAPKLAANTTLFERARARGEIADDVDLDLVSGALAGVMMHRLFLHGERPTAQMVTRVVDHIILPAATRGASTQTTPTPQTPQTPQTTAKDPT